MDKRPPDATDVRADCVEDISCVITGGGCGIRRTIGA
jgi:hypothetical protein